MKHFLEVSHLEPAELIHVLDISEQLQRTREDALHQKTILFSFEKPSLRTKVGTEVAINQLDGKVIHIDPVAFLGGKIMHAAPIPGVDEREALKDTVRNVSRWCDAIFCRVFAHQTLVTLANFSDIPIVNALSDIHHPMQALADFRSIRQHFGNEKVPITFIGDANNVARSLIEMGLMLGYPLRFCSPPKYGWDHATMSRYEEYQQIYGGSLTLFNNPKEAVTDAKVVYTDTFVSMGEESVYKHKMQAFEGYQINEELFDLAAPDAGFMHCLPAHRGVEVTDAVMDHERSWVYDQAENRMIVSKGLFTYLINH